MEGPIWIPTKITSEPLSFNSTSLPLMGEGVYENDIYCVKVGVLLLAGGEESAEIHPPFLHKWRCLLLMQGAIWTQANKTKPIPQQE